VTRDQAIDEEDSVAQSLYPVFRYEDADAALSWLVAAFGARVAEAHRDDDGVVVHAEVEVEGNLIMVGTRRDDPYGRRVGDTRAHVYVAIADADAHHARAVAGGAEIIRELTDQDYGSRDYTALDLEGNVWSFGTYRPAAASASA
jgi:uncharacterized glyoxalase superfamily protein PhnB